MLMRKFVVVVVHVHNNIPTNFNIHYPVVLYYGSLLKKRFLSKKNTALTISFECLAKRNQKTGCGKFLLIYKQSDYNYR